ncbi:MAG TPA: response regulator [Anaerolineae bacterium]|nr:response regulator [Anaerolineae bacterium]
MSTDNNNEQTILIVDDNPTNLSVISDYLEGQGYRILTARDGSLALRIVKRILPDIILLDVMMPKMDGFETCTRLKDHDNPAVREVPVIFMTALSSTEDKVKGFTVGAVDYVTKPLQQEEVLARITTHMRLRQLTKNLQKQNARLEISNQVGQKATSVLDEEELLTTVVQQIQSKFGYYFVSIWLVDENQETLHLRTGAGAPSTADLLARGHTIPLSQEKSIIATAANTSQPYHAADVTNDPHYLRIDTVDQAQQELALPLKVGNTLLGVLDIQTNTDENDITPEDQIVLQTLANQIAIALRNVQLYTREKERADELAELNATKDKFFSIISHDLRSPFNSLMGNSQFMLMEFENLSAKDLQEMIQSIYDSSVAAHDLLQNLLTWSLLQRGRMQPKPATLQAHAIAANTINLLKGNAEEKSITLTNEIDADTHLYGDQNMIDTVIRNLTANALKFTPSGGSITILADETNAIHPDLPPTNNTYTRIAVRDTGLGISPEDQKKLFRLDVHHSTKGTAKEKGTGLGLIVCQDMVEQNNGHIWLESELGQGTTVYFTVPTNPPA